MYTRKLFRIITILVFILFVMASTAGIEFTRAESETKAPSADDGLPGIRYLHMATADNVDDNATFLNHPLINENPNAVFFVTKNLNAGGTVTGTVNEHTIGVWYNDIEERWAIFNQDLALMPVGSDYNVLIPDSPATDVFVHTASAGNINGNSTFIDHPTSNNNPNALVFITQNFNPGGGFGTYNDQPVGVWYDTITNKWAVFNQDGTAMPTGADFNILVTEAGKHAFVHRATSENISGSTTRLGVSKINRDKHALLFVTQNWNPNGFGGTYNDYSIEVAYNYLFDHWNIANLEPGMSVSMTEDAAFNVLYIDEDSPSMTHIVDPGAVNPTYIDYGMLNEEPNAVALSTMNWNPGDRPLGVYNNSPIGLFYDGLYQQWGFFNQDGSSVPDDSAYNVFVPNMDAGVFVHETTSSNTTINSTYIEHPLTDDNPDQILFITSNWNPGGVSGDDHNHVTGVYYATGSDQWAIFNQDGATMDTSIAFNVFIPGEGENVFIHNATGGNTTANSTYLDHLLINGNPDARLLVTQNWNPGGSGGTYNNHPYGVWYSDTADQWAIFNQDTSSMPIGASFNVFVDMDGQYLPLIIK